MIATFSDHRFCLLQFQLQLHCVNVAFVSVYVDEIDFKILILCLADAIVCRIMFQYIITDYVAITCLNTIGVLRSREYAYCGKKICTDR